MRHFPAPLMMIVPFEPMWNSARGGNLRVGDSAPDFTLPRSDKSGDVTLSSLRGKPVVLVFGSYT
jgi:peroxiredoxin